MLHIVTLPSSGEREHAEHYNWQLGRNWPTHNATSCFWCYLPILGSWHISTYNIGKNLQYSDTILINRPIINKLNHIYDWIWTAIHWLHNNCQPLFSYKFIHVVCTLESATHVYPVHCMLAPLLKGWQRPCHWVRGKGASVCHQRRPFHLGQQSMWGTSHCYSRCRQRPVGTNTGISSIASQ